MTPKKYKLAMISCVATLSSLFTGLCVGVASADVPSSVVVNERSPLTSLNPFTPDTDLATNSDLQYLTHSGFNYIGSNNTLIRNPHFGTYFISKNDTSGFSVTYMVRPGQVWSDGAPITAADLMLNQVIDSSDFSVYDGLGDPSKTTPAFNSVKYGNASDRHLLHNSYVLSQDGMSLQINYKSFFPEWESQTPVPFPSHALVMLANNQTFNGTVLDAQLARNQFVSAIENAGAGGPSQALISRIGAVWSSQYNITNVDGSTNPLLLVSNGGFKVQSASDGQSVTFVRNTNYTSGPALMISGPINQIAFRFVPDGSTAVQALANGDIDINDGFPSAAAFQQLKSLTNITKVVAPTMTYEHIDLRVGSSNSLTPDQSARFGRDYTGDFGTGGERVRELRKAFLLALPRKDIASRETYQALDPTSTLAWPTLDSSTGGPTIQSIYTSGSQQDRDAEALAIVKKYYPNASVWNPVVNVRLLFGNVQRRIEEATLIASEEAKAGFNVTTTPIANWSTNLNANTFDATLFAWALPSPLAEDRISILESNFASDGANNHWGWNIPALDNLIADLQTNIDSTKRSDDLQAIDQVLQDNALTMPFYSWYRVISYRSDLSGVTPVYTGGSVVTNYWNWSYSPNQQPGVPSISGAGQLGSYIFADPGTWPNGYTLSYQWIVDGQSVPEATSNIYQVKQSDLGRSIELQVTGTNGSASLTALSNVLQTSSGNTGVDGSSSSSNGQAISGMFILGNLTLGSTVTPQYIYTGDGSDNLQLQWIISGSSGEVTPISNANYQIALADLGSTIGFRIIDTRSDGSVSTFESPQVNISSSVSFVKNSSCAITGLDLSSWQAQTTQKPSISGTPKYGNPLIGVSGSWPTGTKLCSFWYENGSAISSAFNSKYKIQGSDVGQNLQYCVVGSDKKGNALLRYSDPITATNQTIDKLPTPSITGSAVVGAKLTVKYKSFGAGFSYYPQWYRNGEPIPAATSSTYIPTPDDLSKVLSVVVSGNKPYFDPATVSTQTLPVLPAAISHQPTVKFIGNKTSVGSTLTGVAGNWPANAILAVQWLRDGQPISGETKVTYTIATADHGHTVSFQVTASSPGYLDAIKVSTGKVIP